MPKNSANKQYLRVKDSSLLNDVKDSAQSVIYRERPSLPQPPPNVTSANFCFRYDFGSSAFTETLAGAGVNSGFTYYDLTHGIVWSDGTNWNWTSELGVIPTGSTRYATLNNGGKITPDSFGFSWVTFSGASSGTSMTSCLRGVCPPPLSPTPTPSVTPAASSAPTPTPSVTPTITPSPSA
jgi:hypothetical protein